MNSVSVLCRHLAIHKPPKVDSRLSAIQQIQQVSRFATASSLNRVTRVARMSSASNTNQTKDWDAKQYLKFEAERTRPVRDLLAQVPVTSPRRVIDLGCGPGNSTEALVARWPNAHISGMDSSQDMIDKARRRLPDLEFEIGDLNTWVPSPTVDSSEQKSVDVFFSNAVFQWIPSGERLPLITRFLKMQVSGGVFAFQVPDNFLEPSHTAMRETAADAQQPWFATFQGRQPALRQFQSTQEIYDALIPHCQSINIWHTHYYHVLESHQAIVEWVKATGLKPFIDPLSEEERNGFLAAYLARLKKAYPVSVDGKVLLKFPRLFVVAVKK